MTVSSTVSKISYSGNGATTTFSFPYYFLSNADLVVLIRSSLGVETTKILTTDYTLTGAGNPLGGTVTMAVAPATGETLVIFRDPAVTQGADFVENGTLAAETLEMSIDRLTMIAQRLKEVDTRSLKFPETDSTSLSAVYPSSVDRASRVASFDATGAPTTLSIAGLGVTVDNTALVVVAAVAPGHVSGRIWVDTSTANTLIAKQSDGVDWIELWRVATNTNVYSIPNLAATVAQALAGTETTKYMTPDSDAAVWEKGTDIASATSISVPATGGGFFHVTGSTKIDGISGTGIRQGFEVTLVFDGVLTLDHSATFIQPGGFDIVTAVNDVARYRHEGSGTWRCVDFVRADGASIASQGLNTQSGASYTILAADNGKIVKLTNAGAVAVTLPTLATVPIGFKVKVLNAAGGDVTVTRGGSDPVDGGGTAVILQNSGAQKQLEFWTDGVTWYTRTRRFASAVQTITSAGALTIAHGLGATPRVVKAKLRNVTTQANYSVNDEVVISVNAGDQVGAGNRGVSIVADATNLNIRFGSAAGVFAVLNKTTGVNAAITNANWNVIFEAEY